jgi:hypothetical protein
MTAGFELDGSVQLAASLSESALRTGGLCDRMDREYRLRDRAAQATRTIPFVMNIPIVSSAGSLNPAPNCGPDTGYYWSIRQISAIGFTAGQVTIYVDNIAGQPIWTQTGSAVGIYVSDYGKSHKPIHPNSNLAVNCTGITSANNQVIIYGDADQVESWLWPWYLGTVE